MRQIWDGTEPVRPPLRTSAPDKQLRMLTIVRVQGYGMLSVLTFERTRPEVRSAESVKRQVTGSRKTSRRPAERTVKPNKRRESNRGDRRAALNRD